MLEPVIKDNRRWWSREDIILLVLLGVLFLLPGLGKIPLFDRDEPRFATAARTMGETGDFIVPRFNGALRPDKPPFIYWLMNLSNAALGGAEKATELGARLPSAICGILTLIVVYFMTGSRFGRLTGFIAAMMLGSCSLFLVMARFATADSAMLLFIVCCMAFAWQAWDAGPRGTNHGRLPRADYLLDRSGDSAPLMLDLLPEATPRGGGMSLEMALLFWVALAAGALVKGVPLLFVFVPMVVLSIATGALPGQLRQWRSHFHLTRTRVGAALLIAAIDAAFLVAVSTTGMIPEARGWAIVLGILLIAMLLTPGLPGILVRCGWGANWGWWRQLRPMIGVPILIMLVGWWVVWAGMATDWQLIRDMVGNHFLNRAAGPLLKALHLTPLLHALHLDVPDVAGPAGADPMESYGQPPGFYLLTVWGTFWPWSILLVPTVYHVVRRLRGKTAIAIDARPYQFLVAWIVPMWVLLEVARGKLFHYPLPLFVPLAILCADTLVQSWHRLTDVLAAEWFAVVRWGTLLIWLGLGIAVLVLARMHGDRDLLWRCFPFAVTLMAAGFVNAVTWGRPSWPYVMVLCWGGSLMLANTLILPEMMELQVSRLAGGKMKQMKHDDPGLHLAARGYEEPSLVFYAGSNVEMFSSIEGLLNAAPFAPLADPAARRYVVAVDDVTRSGLERRGIWFYPVRRLDFPENLQLTDADRISGFNTANFKSIAVTIITNAPPAATRPKENALPASATGTREAQSAQSKPSGTLE